MSQSTIQARDLGEVAIIAAPVASLRPAAYNPRSITGTRFEQLKRSLQRDPDMLRARPLIALPDGTVVCGNMRLRAAEALGWKTVPTIYADLDETRAREWMLRDNNAYGDYVDQDLAEMLVGLQMDGADLATLGFPDDDLARLLDSVGALGDTPTPEPQLDRAAELQAQWGTALGQLWVAGEHRLLIGDSTDAGQVTRLLDGEVAVLLCTDPPYNVGLDYDDATDDQKAAAEYERFTQAWMTLWGQLSQRAIVTPGCYNLASWLRWFDPYHVAPWTKTNAMTRGYVARFFCWEPILFFGDKWPRTRANDVFDYPVGNQPDTGDHPCPKPIKFWADLVECYSEPGDLVAEAFAGSGTTLVACEQLGRRCRAMEWSPEYAAVTLQRLADSGLTPRRVETD